MIHPKAKAMPFFGVLDCAKNEDSDDDRNGIEGDPQPKGKRLADHPTHSHPTLRASPLAPETARRVGSGPRRSIAHEEVPQRPGDDGDDQRSQDGGEDAVDHDTSAKEPEGEPARRRQDDRADDEPEEA